MLLLIGITSKLASNTSSCMLAACKVANVTASRQSNNMKLGACYNLWDAEELLEKSILSIRKSVEFVVVVWQKTSNFGNTAPNPFLDEFLEDLKAKKLVDEIVFYEPKRFSVAEKEPLTSREGGEEVSGPLHAVGDQFYNELTKREIGRKKCKAAGCTHFISMDSDEFYIFEQLETAKQLIIANNYDATACRMRTIFKEPTLEYYPFDDVNAVPLIYKIRDDGQFRLAEPCQVMLDPTRRVANQKNFHLFPRTVIEMFHMTLVRRNMYSKLENCSNKMNLAFAEKFMKEFDNWTPEMGVIHPHPFIGRFFTEVRSLPNYFDVDIYNECGVCSKTPAGFKCSRCRAIKYCSTRCQHYDWPQHKKKCTPLN